MVSAKYAISEPKYDVKMEFNVKQKMRDGVLLSADIYRPSNQGRFSVILMRTCYSSVEREPSAYEEEIETYKFFASRGYVFVVQDVRGKNNSDGDFYPLIYEANDGFDTQEWCGTQDWSNGRIGTIGGSYLAWTQWFPALLRNPHLKTMISLVAANDPFNNCPYRGGSFMPVQASWSVVVDGRKNQSLRPYGDLLALYKRRPLIELDGAFGRKIRWWKDWIRHSTYDSYWKTQSFEGRYSEIDVPILHISGWFDDSGVGTNLNFTGMVNHGRTERTRRSQKLLVGPWMHRINRERRIAGIDFGPSSIIDLRTIELRWFDHWLKGIDTGIIDEPPVRIFVMGENQWRNEQEWPLARTQFTNFYIHSMGRANSLQGDGSLNSEIPGEESPDSYIFDPENPVPVAEPEPFQIGGPSDRRPAERRDDVLVYATPPIQREIEVTGPLSVKLYAASDARDTDFTATLIDVLPSGYAMWLNDGIIRARYRNSFEEPILLKPGKIYEYAIDLMWTSNLFKKGHRIALEISSSRFPASSPNPNTGGDTGTEIEMICAKQTVYHDRLHPSHVVLPVIPSN
jgi:putative CocE/NonD family hydrolase